MCFMKSIKSNLHILIIPLLMTLIHACGDVETEGYKETESSNSWPQTATSEIDFILSEPIAKLCDMHVKYLDSNGRENDIDVTQKEYHIYNTADVPPRQSYLLQNAKVYLKPKANYLESLDNLTIDDLATFDQGCMVKCNFHSVYPNGMSAGSSSTIDKVDTSALFTPEEVISFINNHATKPLFVAKVNHLWTNDTTKEWKLSVAVNLKID